MFEAAAKKSAQGAEFQLFLARCHVEEEMDERGEEGFGELSNEEIMAQFQAHGAASGKTQVKYRF